MIQPLRACGLGAGAAGACRAADCAGGPARGDVGAGAVAGARASAAATRPGAMGMAREVGAVEGSAGVAGAGGVVSAGSFSGGEETWSGGAKDGATGEVGAPALTVRVFTSTGCMGSVEPMVGCAAALVPAVP